MSVERFLDIYNYWIYIALMMVGFYAVIARTNIIKKTIGLGLFQTGIFLFYISMSVIDDTLPPIRHHGSGDPMTNPLPHALILTAIVVSVSTMAVALAIAFNIRKTFGTVESDEIQKLMEQD
ncbi:MAG: cation:proton antiporter subunit C [Planctomycetota bacterium]